MELGILFSSYCRSVICSIWNSISCLVSGIGFSSFVQINIYVRLPFPVVLSCSIRSSSVWGKGESLILYTVELALLVHKAYRHIACSVWYTYLSMSIKYQSSNRIHSPSPFGLRKTWRIFYELVRLVVEVGSWAEGKEAPSVKVACFSFIPSGEVATAFI